MSGPDNDMERFPSIGWEMQLEAIRERRGEGVGDVFATIVTYYNRGETLVAKFKIHDRWFFLGMRLSNYLWAT